MLKRFCRRHQARLTMLAAWLPLLFLVVLPQYRWITVGIFRMFWRGVVSPDYRWVPVVAIAMITGLVLVNDKLKRLDQSWLEWSLFKGKKANVTLLPLVSRYSWLIYLPLLVLVVPLLAWIEEYIFRYLIHGGMIGVLWGGFFFGLVHLTAGVTLRMSLCLTGHGLVLVALYGATGLAGVFLVHAAYNLIVIAMVVFEMKLKQSLGLWLAGRRRLHLHLPTVTSWLLKPNEWYA